MTLNYINYFLCTLTLNTCEFQISLPFMKLIAISDINKTMRHCISTFELNKRRVNIATSRENSLFFVESYPISLIQEKTPSPLILEFPPSGMASCTLQLQISFPFVYLFLCFHNFILYHLLIPPSPCLPCVCCISFRLFEEYFHT